MPPDDIDAQLAMFARQYNWIVVEAIRVRMFGGTDAQRRELIARRAQLKREWDRWYQAHSS